MRRRVGGVLTATAIGLVLAGPLAPVSAQVIPRPRPPVAAAQAATLNHGTVYLFRGLADVFSTGMNTLANELKAKGVPAVATSHTKALKLAAEIAKRYPKDASIPPIVLVGHSLGANRALDMAARLGEHGIPVRLVVLFDATVKVPVPKNVKEVLNLYKPSKVGVAVEGVEGYAGTIDNKDVSSLPGIGHISIDKSKTLHAEVIDKVMGVFAEKPAKGKKKK